MEQIVDKVLEVDNTYKFYKDDVHQALTYVLFAQVYVLLTSIRLGINSGNPRPYGMVNRVVKGVNIYHYDK